jgi:hypothetical protein
MHASGEAAFHLTKRGSYSQVVSRQEFLPVGINICNQLHCLHLHNLQQFHYTDEKNTTFMDESKGLLYAM